MSTQQSSHDSQSWEKFCDLRLGYLRTLGDVVEQAFIRQDTEHPAFCGCIDWHSSVHGAYALLTAARLRVHGRWAEIVDSALTTKCLDAELESLQKGDLGLELPYGFAWFLQLAIEREKGWGKQDLVPLAAEIASQLEEWIFSLRAGEVIAHLKQRDYGNLSWVLLNMRQWSQWQADHKLMEKLRGFTRNWVVLLDERLPPSYDQVTDEFFAASLQRTRAILSILPKEESLPWYESYYPDGLFMEPLCVASTPHSAGLNFSRAWSFWTLFQFTQDPKFRDMYANHIVTHINLPDCWRDDYRNHAHWVPQFGIYAIALSMDG
jgi:hypothetical protein